MIPKRDRPGFSSIPVPGSSDGLLAARSGDGNRPREVCRQSRAGLSRRRLTTVDTLAGRRDKRDVVHVLIRPGLTDQPIENGGKNSLTAGVP
jgi:hypothetical protein